MFLAVSDSWTFSLFDIEPSFPINAVNFCCLFLDKMLSGLRQSLMGVLLSDVCAKTSIDVTLPGPAVAVFVGVRGCLCVNLFLRTFLERFDSNSPKTPHCLLYSHTFLSIFRFFSIFHPLPFPILCSEASVTVASTRVPFLCTLIFLSQHAQRVQQRLLIFDYVCSDSSMWSLSFFLRPNNRICHPSVCDCECPPNCPILWAHVALCLGLGWYMDFQILALN